MGIVETLLESSSHAIITMDSEGIITHINSQAMERFGLINHSSYSHPAGQMCIRDRPPSKDASSNHMDPDLRLAS